MIADAIRKQFAGLNGRGYTPLAIYMATETAGKLVCEVAPFSAGVAATEFAGVKIIIDERETEPVVAGTRRSINPHGGSEHLLATLAPAYR